MRARWSRADIAFGVLAEATEHPVVTVEVSVPGGTLLVMGESEEVGSTLVVRGAHISSWGLVPNTVGVANLRLLAEIVMEAMGYDEIEIIGEVRTTGAGPGHRPRPFRFTRGRVADGGSGSDPGADD